MFMNLPLTPPSCRHTPEKKAQRPPLCLMPFGGGQRICIGRKIASVIYKMTVIEAPDTEVLSNENNIHLRRIMFNAPPSQFANLKASAL